MQATGILEKYHVSRGDNLCLLRSLGIFLETGRKEMFDQWDSEEYVHRTIH